jgi:thiamine pyrophosphokinase
MRIIIFANGNFPHLQQDAQLLREDDFILCADGGARHARALDLTPNLIIGDLDSLDIPTIATMRQAGVPIRRYPADKDFTDLELALQAAQEMHPDEIILLGALGGRLDQTLANILLLTHPDYIDLPIRLISGPESAQIVSKEAVIRGHPGDVLSVLPLTTNVTGLTYHSGLRWLLRDATLTLGSTRGVSNQLIATEARISLQTGVILVIHTQTTSQTL